MPKTDISSLIKGTKSQLGREASSQVADYAESFGRQLLGLKPRVPPGSGIPLSKEQQPRSSIWNASSYAAALAGGTELRPKLKFLFKVQFVFNPQVKQIYPEMFKKLEQNRFTYLIKQVDRPKVDFDYEEEVNKYNFRTKALKRITHRELTVTFMDDVGNNVFDFFRTLMMVYSPITRDAVLRDNNVNAFPNATKYQLGSGMSFSDPNTLNQDDVAHRGVINANAGQAIDLIRVKQIFIDPSDRARSVKAIFYDFINPRLKSFDLDDLSHESSDVNLLTMQFDYDWLEMTRHDDLIATGDGGPNNTITPPGYVTSAFGDRGVNGAQQFSGPGVPADILKGEFSGTAPPKGAKDQIGGGGNPFLNIISGATGKIGQKLLSDNISRGVKAIAGNGKFANSSLGRAVTSGLTNAGTGLAGSFGSAVTGSIRSITGQPLGGAGGFSIASIFSSSKSGSATGSSTLVADSGTPGADSALSGRTSNGGGG